LRAIVDFNDDSTFSTFAFPTSDPSIGGKTIFPLVGTIILGIFLVCPDWVLILNICVYLRPTLSGSQIPDIKIPAEAWPQEAIVTKHLDNRKKIIMKLCPFPGKFNSWIRSEFGSTTADSQRRQHFKIRIAT